MDALLAEARADADVNAVLLFGSEAQGEPARDVDVAMVLRRAFVGEIGDKQLQYAAFASGRRHEGVDASIFQALPLYVRRQVLRDAKPLFAKDEDELDALAIRTAKAWEDLRPYYDSYVEEVLRGRA